MARGCGARGSWREAGLAGVRSRGSHAPPAEALQEKGLLVNALGMTHSRWREEKKQNERKMRRKKVKKIIWGRR